MHQLQGRVANAIFPKVADLLSQQTNEFVGFIEKFKIHLNALSSNAENIADEVDLGSDIHIDVESRLSTFLEQSLQQAENLIEIEQEKILSLLDNFVGEDVEEHISEARKQVGEVWGRGTTSAQTHEVRVFYRELNNHRLKAGGLK